MRKIRFICLWLLLCGWFVGATRADTFQLTDGRTLTGDIVAGSANDAGLQVRLADGSYERVAWTSFSQEDLKKFAQDKKLASFVEPFIEVSQEERLKRTEVKLNDVPRLERPAPQSLLGAMFSSSIGAFLLLLIYAANIYAAYEISIFRARPIALVCGVSAVLPLIGPILFLSLRPPLKPSEEGEVLAEEPARTFNVPTDPGESATAEDHAGGLRIAHAETGPTGGEKSKSQVFQRGTFTFNRRFFETRFPGFFGIVRREAEKDLVLRIKSARGEYTCQRVTRIAANDVHVQVQTGTASEEIMIPFSEIQEVQLKHKDS